MTKETRFKLGCEYLQKCYTHLQSSIEGYENEVHFILMQSDWSATVRYAEGKLNIPIGPDQLNTIVMKGEGIGIYNYLPTKSLLSSTPPGGNPFNPSPLELQITRVKFKLISLHTPEIRMRVDIYNLIFPDFEPRLISGYDYSPDEDLTINKVTSGIFYGVEQTDAPNAPKSLWGVTLLMKTQKLDLDIDYNEKEGGPPIPSPEK